VLRTAVPALIFGMRLTASVCLALYIAFWLQLDNAYWAGASAAAVSQPILGASLRKGWYRMIGTLVGALFIVVLTACFVQNRAAFLVGLTLWGAACTLVATLLRNFAAYAASLAGITSVIVASDELGTTGGAAGTAFMFAITRASEICIGIACAGVVLSATDFGGARRRLAVLLATLAEDITSRFVGALGEMHTGVPNTQMIRRELIHRVIALEPAIDQAIGESSQLRLNSRRLEQAVYGLVGALAGWRAVACHLAQSPRDWHGDGEVAAVLTSLPHQDARGWAQGPSGLRRRFQDAVRTLIGTRPGTPSQQLLIDQAAHVLAGISKVLRGLELLLSNAPLPIRKYDQRRLQVADWAPPLVNAGRAFLAIGVSELVWVVSGWPSGTTCVIWTAITVILFGPRVDNGQAGVRGFFLGTCIAVLLAAVVKFSLLPQFDSFFGLSVALACYLIPVGALSTLGWQTAVFAPMAVNFVALLTPENAISYDLSQFYNSSLALLAGSGTALLAFRIVPPLSPAFRTQRLLTLTLNDLRLLVRRPLPLRSEQWERRIYNRISVLPDSAQPLQRAQMLAALAVGTEVIRLNRIARRLRLDVQLHPLVRAMVKGDSTLVSAALVQLDAHLADAPQQGQRARLALHARGSALALSEVLTQHSDYFNRGAAR
jgi:uncharacterized membrane protein YccC